MCVHKNLNTTVHWMKFTPVLRDEVNVIWRTTSCFTFLSSLSEYWNCKKNVSCVITFSNSDTKNILFLFCFNWRISHKSWQRRDFLNIFQIFKDGSLFVSKNGWKINIYNRVIHWYERKIINLYRWQIVFGYIVVINRNVLTRINYICIMCLFLW